MATGYKSLSDSSLRESAVYRQQSHLVRRYPLDRLGWSVEREKLAESQERVVGIADTGFWMAIGMDAGYLVGLEMGKRMAQGGAR